jgi:hypothetical protein
VKDTTPRVATCNRCSGVVIVAMACGFRAAVEPVTLTFDQMRDELVQGAQMYRVYQQNGKPTKLEPVHVAMLKSPASRYGSFAPAHGCGCHPQDSTALEEAPGPFSGLPADAKGDPREQSAAQTVTSRPSELPSIRCANCRETIARGDPNRFQLEVPVWDEVVQHVPNRGTKRGYTKVHAGWGVKRWAIHAGPDGCPAAPTTGRT